MIKRGFTKYYFTTADKSLLPSPSSKQKELHSSPQRGVELEYE